MKYERVYRLPNNCTNYQKSRVSEREGKGGAVACLHLTLILWEEPRMGIGLWLFMWGYYAVEPLIRYRYWRSLGCWCVVKLGIIGLRGRHGALRNCMQRWLIVAAHSLWVYYWRKASMSLHTLLVPLMLVVLLPWHILWSIANVRVHNFFF